MPARKSKPSKAKATDPWTALDAIFKQEAEPMGPEWFTASRFAERYNRSRTVASGMLNELVKDGKMLKWSGISSDTRRTISKYRLA